MSLPKVSIEFLYINEIRKIFLTFPFPNFSTVVIECPVLMGHHANVSHPSFFPVFNADTFTITHCPPDQAGTIHQGSRRGAIRRILSEISYTGASQLVKDLCYD